MHSRNALLGCRKPGGPLRDLHKVVDFEQFRELLAPVQRYAGGSEGGRTPYDPVVMFKILILAAWHILSDERMAYETSPPLRFPQYRPRIYGTLNSQRIIALVQRLRNPE